jgi:PAS domain S-box-containing protein
MKHLSETILENILAGYWEWDFSANTVFLSNKLKASLGYAPQELDERPETIQALIEPEDLQAFLATFQAHVAQPEAPFCIDLRYRHKQGHIVWINCTGYVSEWEQEGKARKAVGCHTDITRSKEAEAALLEQKKLVEDFFEINIDLFCVLDTQGSFIKSNAQWEKLGYSSEELAAIRLDMLFDEAEISPLALLQEGQESIVECVNRVRCKDGSYRHFEWRMALRQGKIYAAARDISIRVKALADLEKSGLVQASLISALSEGILLQDRQSRILLFNEAAERIWGRKLEKMQRLPDAQDAAWKVVHEDGQVFLEEEYPAFRCLQTGQALFNTIMGVYKQENELAWILVNSVPIFNGEVVEAVVSSFTDITDLKSKEEKIFDTLRAVVHQKNKLENFAHIVAHNLRAHAGNIYSLISIIEEAKDEEEKNTFLAYVKKASTQLNQTIQDLNEILDASRAEGKKTIYIKDFVNHILDNLIVDLQHKKVKLRINIPEEMSIEYSPAYLESILLNFITNSIKYKHPYRNPVITLTGYMEGKSPVLEISDNGIGIDLAKYGDKLFGMYKTFHGNKDAKGIGLYITKNQIEEMGGKVEVQSTLDQGTTFKIYLRRL